MGLIEEFAALVPPKMQEKSGAVFYSGRAAFSAPSPLYILGHNPGGSPTRQTGDTVSKHTHAVLFSESDEWSEYEEGVWNGDKGVSPVQRRVLRLLSNVGFAPKTTPASNLVFLRSTAEKDIRRDFEELAEQCWRFHEAVIKRLGVRVILCFGNKVGDWVRTKVGAYTRFNEFVEDNNRRWKSSSYKNADGLAVVVAKHPSRADWTNPKTDPSQLVRELLH